jgi:hypothetical protein
MPSVIQRAFNGGEVSPKLAPARVDQARVAYGVREMTNMIAEVGGAVHNRSGTRYRGATESMARVIPFMTGDDGNFLFEMGEHSIRIWQDGERLTWVGSAWDGGTTYSMGDVVTAGGNYYVSMRDGNVANDPTAAAYPSNGYQASASAYWFLSSAQAIDDIAEAILPTVPPAEPVEWGSIDPDLYPDIRFDQSDNLMVLTLPGKTPRKIIRDKATGFWSVTRMAFVPEIDGPTGVTATAGGAGANSYGYRVTAFNRETREESLVGTMAAASVVDITNSTPYLVQTTAAHGMATGDEVSFTDLVAFAFLMEGTWTVTVTGASAFTIDGTAGPGSTTTLVGNYVKHQARISSAAAATPAAPHMIGWTAVDGADSYVIYRTENGVYGFVGVARGTAFNDIGYTPDTADGPPLLYQPFGIDDDQDGEYPTAVAFTNQRLAFAATESEPQGIWMSRIGRFENFTVSSPIKDDDAVNFPIASGQTRRINALVEIGRLLALSAAAEWAIDGEGGGAITPNTVRARRQTYDGAANIAPLPAGAAALYVGDRSNSIREISYSELNQGERSRDLLTWAGHLLEGYTVVEWAHQRVPDSIVWVARSDGILLGMTYQPDQEVVAWHRHDVGGAVRSLCIVPEDDRDVLYMVVEREINGGTVYYIETMTPRRTGVNAAFMDSSLNWNGNNTTATTVTLTTAGGWTVDDTLTATASAAFFNSGMVGQMFRATVGGVEVWLTVTGYTSTTVISVQPESTVPVSHRAVAINDFDEARNYIYAVHLEGETVAILGDGFVMSEDVVTGGVVQLDTHATNISVGLPYVSRLETLDLEFPDGETLLDKAMRVHRVGLLFHETRRGWVGPDAANMVAWTQKSGEDWDDTINTFTGLAEINLRGRFNKHGRVTIEQRDPLPMRITALIRVGEVGGN